MTQQVCDRTGQTVQLVGTLPTCEHRQCGHVTCKDHLHRYGQQESQRAWGMDNKWDAPIARPTNELWLNDGRA